MREGVRRLDVAVELAIYVAVAHLKYTRVAFL